MTAPVSTPCQIVQMELAEGAQPLTLDATRYRAVGVYFLLDGAPLGHKFLNAGELPLNKEQMWEVAIEAILPALTGHLLQHVSGAGESAVQRLAALNPFASFREAVRQQRAVRVSTTISVIICTRERPAALAKCLASLQKLAEQPFEILVVDNAPTTDATRRVVNDFPTVRYKVEPRPGLSFARNTGVRASRGDIIAFTDDDVEVTANWLSSLVRPFADPAVGCTTGLVIPAEMETAEQSLFESWLSFHRGYLPRRFGPEWLRNFRGAPPVWDLGAGANMALRRSAFEKTGLFDTRLGAGASGCSEDSELWYRLLAAGYSCQYEPSSLVLHHHRANRRQLTGQMRMYSRGHVAALLIQFARHRNFGNLLRAFVGLPIYHLRRFGASVMFPGTASYWAASAQGYFAGLIWLGRNFRDRSDEELVERRAPVRTKAIAAFRQGETNGKQ
ncbi:MAG: glycosyl transferase family protein [Bryobacterales bacterium]|nr:glycosyl transferase family protein [Bryobacterales bacterium]